MVVFVHHHLPAQRRFLYTIVHPPMVVFVHHCAPAQRWYLYTIAHPPNGGFRTPPLTCPTVVFVRHCPPAQWRFSCTIVHPSQGGFCTPSRARPTVVLMHHRRPVQLWFALPRFYLPTHLLSLFEGHVIVGSFSHQYNMFQSRLHQAPSHLYFSPFRQSNMIRYSHESSCFINIIGSLSTPKLYGIRFNVDRALLPLSLSSAYFSTVCVMYINCVNFQQPVVFLPLLPFSMKLHVAGESFLSSYCSSLTTEFVMSRVSLCCLPKFTEYV